MTERELPYVVEIDDEGCKECGAEKTWIVIGPDGFGSGTSYGSKDEALGMADNLNEAYYFGKNNIWNKNEDKAL